MGVKTGLIVFRHPSRIRGPWLVKFFLHVGFGGIVTAKLGENAPGPDIEERRGSVASGVNWQTQTSHLQFEFSS